MKIFFDFEFTGLQQYTTPISLGMISEDGRDFYAEFGDYDYLQVDTWVQDNVLSKLEYHNKSNSYVKWCETKILSNHTRAYGNKEHIKNSVRKWLSVYDYVEMWSDCLAYDWILFCDLWGRAFDIPKNIYYIPFDISTLFKLKEIDPDIDREAFADRSSTYNEKHNALWDAQVIRACYNRLMEI